LPERAPAGRRAAYLKLALLLAIVAGALVAARALGLFRFTDLPTLARTVRGLEQRPYMAPLFVAIYALATTLALPGSVLSLAGGAIFGFGLGTLLNWLGASIGATLAYFLARALGLDAVRRILGRRADALERLAGTHGFATVLRLRLIPVVPFNMLNFAAGLAGVRARDYLLGTVIGLLPACAVYTYFADALLSGAAGVQGVLVKAVGAGAVLVGLSFLPGAVKRRAKGERHDREQ
jgi:uncharacterized membrane protein YdjX (TVP38/TMEM64 family)